MFMSRWVVIVTVACALAIVALGQVSPIAGIWYGTFSPSGRPSPVSLVFQSQGADWVGSLLLADGRGIPLKDVTLSGDTITFALELPQVKATFKGTLSADRKDLRGEFTQNGITSLLEVSRDSKKIVDATPSIDPHELIEMMTSMPAALSDRPFVPPVTYPAIGYGVRTAHDPIAQLTADIDAGTLHLSFEKDQGYLHSLLNALKIPVESQMAVFSQTSLQAPLIGPQNPRVIYFNDSVIVASVRGGFIEVAAQDPELGAHFYTLLQQPVDKPFFLQPNACLGCHLSRNSLDIPGMLSRSVYVTPAGGPINPLGTHLVDHRTPFSERWGGWYVTGKTGMMRHLGNAFVFDVDKPESMVTDATLNLATLKGRFETDAYLAPQSDVVALMVFNHQMHMMNLITRVGWDYRLATSLETDAGKPSEVIEKQLRDDVEEFVDYLLFVGEAPLPNKIEGLSGFVETFASQGPMDSKGRSLRQFDLEHRLMRYRCSYMIYSPAFDGMPDRAKKAIYARIREVIERFPASDRNAVLEILRETKKDF
jgi:hypothetical protein